MMGSRSVRWLAARSTLALALVAACSDDPTVWNDVHGAAGNDDSAASGSGPKAGGSGGSGAGNSGSPAAGSSLGGLGAGGIGGQLAGSSAVSHDAGDGGVAPTVDGGNGGQPPIGDPGGAAGQDGSAGEPPIIGPGKRQLGSACKTTSQCGAGLECVTATSGLLGGGSPPNGVCSKACSADATCEALSTGALCFPFVGAGYCMEGCSFGPTELGSPKCHDRADFACMPALLGDTSQSCLDAGDCELGELCVAGSCNVVFPACLPTCRGDRDCATGLFCDQGFLGGTCVAQKPTGKKLGEPCTVPGPSDPAEPDGCLGFCQADSDAGNAGHCAATCGIGYECGWDPSADQFGGACLYASTLTEGIGAVGDFGLCTQACNCSGECGDASLACLVLPEGELTTDFTGPGLCFSPEALGEELELCD